MQIRLNILTSEIRGEILLECGSMAVSYTHLDVYKRQVYKRSRMGMKATRWLCQSVINFRW